MLLVFVEGLTGRRLLAPSDGHTYYLPLHVSVARQWRQGSFPAWDHGTFAGSPLYGIGQSAALHPSTLLHLLFGPVAAHNLAVLAALVIAGVGAHLLALRLTGDTLAAAVAGCAFALCGFQFAHLAHLAILATVAWLPWCLWAADRLAERLSADRLAAGAACVAAASLAGHGQMLAYTAAVTVAYAVVRGGGDGTWSRRAVAAAGPRGGGGDGAELAGSPGLVARRASRWGRSALASTAGVAAMLVVGAGAAAVQLLPVAAVVGGSDRNAFDHAQATAFSYAPSGVLVTLFPFLYGNARAEGPVQATYSGEWSLTELGGYVGVAALVLAAAALPLVRRDRRLLALVVVAVVSVLVALGDSTPISRVVHALPLFGQMRSWARYTVGAQLAVAVLAGAGVAHVRRERSPSHSAWVAAVSVVALGVVVLAGPWLVDRRVDGGERTWVLASATVAAGAAALGLGLVRRRPAAAAVLVLLVSVDAVVGFGWWFRWRTAASPRPERAVALVEGREPGPWAPVPDAPGGIDRYVWAGDPLAVMPYTPRMASAAGQRSVTGMEPLAPDGYLDATGTDYWGRLLDPSPLLDRRSHLLDLLRVTVVADAGDGGPGARRTVREPALPEAFVVGRARAATQAEAIAAAIGDAPLEPGEEAVIDQECDGCPWDEAVGRTGEAGPIRWGNASASVEVTAERASLLVVSQAWAPGWTAKVDGRSVPVVRADGVVQAVPVPAGRSTVELRYRPPGLVPGAWISGVAVLALAAAVVVERRRRRAHDGTHPSFLA